MPSSRRNRVEEQQEAWRKPKQITAICDQLSLTLDPIDWQHWGMRAAVKVNSIERASRLDLSQRVRDDLLRRIELKLVERVALKSIHPRPGLKVSLWSPVEVVQPQAFLSLWILTLETDERIPIMESIRNGERVYEPYTLDRDDMQQLTKLFGPASQGAYSLGDRITIKEHERQYTGEIIYSIPVGKALPSRKYASRGSPLIAGTAYTDDVAARYIVDCNDGFPHIVHQSQVIS
ncbi:MAG TPA: hypothetical protein VFA10_30000 [Ktedonobacteraceae bacterium]|nr:hypothetical protein [Ktedonobacteraceae bacterium]